MLKFIIAEIKYSWILLFLPTAGILIYTFFVLIDIQLTTSPAFEMDYWGGIFGFILYAYIIAVWGTRIKEKRIRLSTLLPVSQTDNSLARFYLASFPFIFITIYLVFIHLILISTWHKETASMLGQIGVTLILFAGFIKGRDDWFSHWNLGKRFQKTFVTILIIQIAFVFVFLEMESFKVWLVSFWGRDIINFSTLIFPLLGLVTMTTNVYSFRKRKSYLS